MDIGIANDSAKWCPKIWGKKKKLKKRQGKKKKKTILQQNQRKKIYKNCKVYK